METKNNAGALSQPILSAGVAQPHWIDCQQSALGGKTAREGYAANPEYAIAAAPVTWKTLADKAVAVLGRHIEPGGIGDKDALTELYGIFDGPDYRAALASAPAAPTEQADSMAKAMNRIRELETALFEISNPIANPVGNPWAFYEDVRKFAADAISIPFVPMATPELAAQQATKLTWPEVSAAANAANQSFGQWMPERWVQAFVTAYNGAVLASMSADAQSKGGA